MRDDVYLTSLLFAHVTASLNINHARARAAATAVSALARSLSRAMAVTIKTDDTPTTCDYVDGTCTCVDGAHVRGDVFAKSLMFAHVTASLNINHARARAAAAAASALARSLSRAMAVAITIDDAPMKCGYVDGACACVDGAHVRDGAFATSLMFAHVTESLNINHARVRAAARATAAASALARSLSRAMAVAITADDAPMTRALR